MMKPEVLTFIDEFINEVKEDNAAIFAGAGLSAPAGFLDWKGLLNPIAKKLKLDIDKESDLVSLAQFHVNSNGNNRSALNNAILNAFSDETKTTDNHKILSRLPISTWWTTNYDRLIENSLKSRGKIVDVKYDINQLAITKSRRDATVYKMHGDIEHPDKAILIKDDYEKYHSTHGAFINALTGDLVSKTFVFLGFSFSDPNLDYILSRIRITFSVNQRQHFAFFRTCDRKSFSTDNEFEYAKIRQSLVIEDLKRFNIKVILVDEYSEITEAFAELYRRLKSQTIFISSSMDDFAPWDELAVMEFLQKLGGMIIEEGFRICTGYGKGVGNAIISGALEKIYRGRKGRIEDFLIIRPFPQYIPEKEERERVWNEYRNEIIAESGLILFLFGNKKVDGKTINADGIRKEFEIARTQGLGLLPIGATKYMSHELANELFLEQKRADRENDTEITKLLVLLNNEAENLNLLLEPISNLLKSVKKG